jgi:hypothetical protein
MFPSVATEKIPSVTPPGIDPETVRLVAQCLNHYATPGPWNSTVQYSTVHYITVHYSTLQYSTVQYSTVKYSTVQCSTVQ